MQQEMAAPSFLPGMESFCLSLQTSTSEPSSSPCSMIHLEDFKDDFGVDVRDFNVPLDSSTELTRLDMACSGVEWLERELPYQTSQDSMIANRRDSTPNRNCDMTAYKNTVLDVDTSAAVAFPSPSMPMKDHLFHRPEVIEGTSHFRTVELSRREPSISHGFHESQTHHKDVTSYRAPKVLSHCAPHERKEPKSPDEELKRERNLVPDEFKDERYWRKRSRNNMSARKSREAKRARDILIAHKIDQLEKENAMLKMMLANVMMQQQQQQQNHYFQWQ